MENEEENYMKPELLKEIAKWNENSKVEIPSVQRGLVWKPIQVELLWDSIFRGFPIGSFMIQQDGKKNYLLDGQQRYNAIEIGFHDWYIKEDSTKAILWIDLSPTKNQNSTRKFWIKATTTAHPWGYHNDDSCGCLSASERRDAMANFALNDKNIYKDKISFKQTWPIMCNIPFPLSIFLSCDYSSNDNFFISLNEKITRFGKENTKWWEFVKDQYLELKKANKQVFDNAFYDALKTISEYSISFNTITTNIINKESEDNNPENLSNLEVLFNRLNTGGTQITQTELSYSAIKVYWPNVKDINEEISNSLMPAHIFAVLTFRLAKMLASKDKKWVYSLNVKNIRKMKEDKSVQEIIKELYDNKYIETIIKNIEDWLTDNNEWGIPKILRTFTIIQYPDIFLLLMYFAHHGIELQNKKYIPALVLYLKWFCGDISYACSYIYEHQKDSLSEININMALIELIRKEIIHPLYSPKDMEQFIDIEHCGYKWNFEKLGQEHFYGFFNCILEQDELVLYAERKFLNEEFKIYDPSQKNAWKEHNRPWDIDHIIPQDWLYKKKSGDWRNFDNCWMYTIGNLAAIPFEINRAKNCYADWSYYKKHKKDLFFSEEFYDIDEDLRNDKTQSIRFGRVVLNRMIRIYANSYDNLFESLLTNINCDSKDNKCIRRKQLFENVNKELALIDSTVTIETLFINNSYNYKEFIINNERDWFSAWVSINIKIDDEASVSLNGNGDTLEFGIRKGKDKMHTSDRWWGRSICKDYKDSMEYYKSKEENSWWYICKEENSDNLNDKDIASRMYSLYKAIIEFKKVKNIHNEVSN